ncbi:cryptochrome/photolyase family protein [Thalassomonas haliotis]|uniref:Deoxyribodipyrimidine photo-lyase n=1 Tax=Thalassomonas haliotis TaxID=485448 RepID=A0ABY7VJ61_9GAMM|nr:deoxyribodipyrimidine photo-lyase [Thalassomonas haliotis]WDE13558.1 deoxyribodipyrimidine photo-lyase [Thalassomonas haliotis]
MKNDIAIIWFRQDLRLSDNPALTAAARHAHVLPLYILDDHNGGEHTIGAASKWWLHYSLKSLNTSLNESLSLYQGEPMAILTDILSRYQVTAVYWNRCYEPWQITRDKHIKARLSALGITVNSFNASLQHEPWTILKNDNTPYQIFTPYYRRANLLDTDTQALPAPGITGALCQDSQSISLEALKLRPKIRWDGNFYPCWTPGEAGAQSSLDQFLAHGLENYQAGRDFPGLKAVSRLSPHLHFGEISPRQINQALLSLPDDNNREHFKRELSWREFSYYLLFHWPELPEKNLKTHFTHFAWSDNPESLKRWQQGLTGYPLVDAGMRELWQTGFMHNRVRMICASFLVKNLLIDWRLGARWFWQCLVDADLASNSASWQWVAGCGTDASPYFRIFNPITQGEKFDPQGTYIKHFLPELKNLPLKYLFRPWQAPADILKKANITLGQDYPLPMVDIKESRENALAAYHQIKHLSHS